MNKAEYKRYLQSDHWKALRAEKFKRVEKVRCFICHCNHALQVHHVKYKAIFNVQPKHLKLLCPRCHDLVHQVLFDNPVRQVGVIRTWHVCASLAAGVLMRSGVKITPLQKRQAFNAEAQMDEMKNQILSGRYPFKLHRGQQDWLNRHVDMVKDPDVVVREPYCPNGCDDTRPRRIPQLKAQPICPF